jgi:uncharacterized repeat protein (TIGR01451 family)
VSQGSCSTTGQTVSCALGALDAGITAGLLSDRPAGFWRLGDAPSSSVAADSSGNGLSGVYDPGVLRGQPGAISGDTAAAFSGSVTVSVPNATSLDIRNAVSVEAWVRPSTSQNGGILEKTVDGWANSQYMLFLEGGVAKFRLRNAAGALLTLDGPTLPLNTWSHVVGTFDGATMRIYVNAALSSSAAASGPLAGGSGATFIGRLGQSLYPFQGTLDEVAVFPVALSAARVRAHYQGGGASLRLSATATASGSQRATAQASATESDPDTTNNTVNLDSTISAPRADLALSGTVSPEPAAIGDTLTYQYALTNNGPARASGVTLVVTLAAGLSAGAATVSQGSCSITGQTVSCALGVLEAGITAGLLSDRPAGFWRLGDAPTSSVAADSSGNGLSGVYDPGVLRGQPGAISGDTAAAFSGSVTVTVPNATSLDIRDAVSVEAWVRPSASQNGGILEKTVDGWANSQYMLFLEAGVAKFRLRNAAGLLQTVDGPALVLNSWSHVVGTFDGTTMRIYVNGALAASAAQAGPLAGGSGATFIGRLGQSYYPFQGSLDEVAVFPIALSAERVRAHYQGGGASLRLSATATAAGSQRTTAQASATESDPDTTNNTLNLDSTIN